MSPLMNVPINSPILGEEEETLVKEVLRSGQLTSSSLKGGEMVRRFEEGLRDFIKAKDIVAVSSGTAALQIALITLGIGVGDEVIVPSFTFVATANAILSVGAKPVFVDIDEHYTIDPEDVIKKITNKTKAIIPVHLYGHVANLEAILEIANKRSLYVIEDAAQALGSEYRGKMVGRWGDVGCLSFHPSKIITTGEGGALIFEDEKLAEKARMIRNHGMVKGYDSRIFGLNFRMSEIHAAIGIAQLKRLNEFLKRRRENAEKLRRLLTGIEEIKLPREREGCRYNWYLFTISSSKRNEIKRALEEEGIHARIYYETPVHKLPSFNLNIDLPRTDIASKSVLSLPVHPKVNNVVLEKIAYTVRKALKA